MEDKAEPISSVAWFSCILIATLGQAVVSELTGFSRTYSIALLIVAALCAVSFLSAFALNAWRSRHHSRHTKDLYRPFV